MGNEASRNVDWKIKLDHEKGRHSSLAFVAGNPLKGKVIARVHKTVPPTKITLYFIGKEKTRRTYTERSGNQTTTRTICGQRTIVCASLTLREDRHSNLHPGVHKFAFCFPLSDSLPSSMSAVMADEKRSPWKIQYKLYVSATNRQGTVNKCGERYVVIVSSPLPATQVPARIPPKSMSIEGTFNTKKGMLTLGAFVKDAHVGRGLPLEINLATRNHSTATIHRVECKLVEKIHWTVDVHHDSSEQTIVLLEDVDVPGILRGKQSKSDVAEWKRTGFNLQDIFRDLEQGANRITLPIPWGCRDTFHGNLIRIEHYLEITIFTKMLVTNPNVRIPVRIGFPPVSSTSQQSESAPDPEIYHRPEQFEIEVDAEPIGAASRPLFTHASCPGLPDTDVPPPIATAILVEDESTIQAPLAIATAEAFALGGLPVYTDEQASVYPSPSPAPSSTPTIAVLLEEMTYSICDYQIILRKLEDPQWKALLSHLSPEDFGSILAHVNMDSDQPRVAETLAQCIGTRFTCAYCRTAAQNGADWNTSAIVQCLLPYCVDIATNHQAIRSALSEWDQTVCRRDFDIAISRRI